MSGTGFNKGDEAGSTTDPNGNPVTSTGAPANPSAGTQAVAPGSVGYGQNYSTPMYNLTPQSGYSGLYQQLAQSFNLSPQSFAAPRTSLLSMYASPWGALPYMNPNQQTLGQMWGQNPAMGTAPPPGTPGFLGQNNNTPLPSPNAPPPTQSPPPPPGSGAPSATPPGTTPPVGTPPPPGMGVPSGRPGGMKMMPDTMGDPNAAVFRNQAKQSAYNAGAFNKGGMSNPPPPPGDFTTPDPGANYGYAGSQGGMLNNFSALGGNVGQYGAAMAMMAQKRNEMARTPQGLNDVQLFQAGKQGIDPRDMQNSWWQQNQGGDASGIWQNRNTLQPYTNEHSYFRTTPVSGIYGKK